jgi:hypothetical protein
MNTRTAVCLFFLCAMPATTLWAADACAPEGNAQFICGLKNPEDLVRVPQSNWVIASGMADAATPSGALYAIDIRNRSVKTLYPSASSRPRHDRKTYGACPGPLEGGQFGPHGIDIRQKGKGPHTLYVVNHVGRESIEVFELDVNGSAPAVTWIGCVVYPPKASGNGVAALPDGGFATTNFRDPGDTNAFQRMGAGEITGSVLEWHADKGWSTIADSAMSGPNGIVATPDGKSLYVAGWPAKNVTRFERGAAAPKKEVISTGILTDNLRWMADGSILAGGQDASMPAIFQCQAPKCRVGSAAVKIDPRARTSVRIAAYPGSAAFEGSTTALPVGDEIWLGSFRGERIARLPAPVASH